MSKKETEEEEYEEEEEEEEEYEEEETPKPKPKSKSKRVTEPKPKPKPKVRQSELDPRFTTVEFPMDMSQAEADTFERNSGMGIMELPKLLGTTEGPKIRGMATLVMIGLAREGIKMSVDQLIKDGTYVLTLEGTPWAELDENADPLT